MTPKQALDHLKWRFTEKDKNGRVVLKKSIKPYVKDADALNTLIEFYTTQNQKAVTDNKLFAKLFIEKFIYICETRHATSKSALQEIERILSMSVYEMVLKLKEKLPMFKFNSIGQDTEPLDISKFDNYTYILERNNKIVDNHTKELKEALKTTYTEEQAIGFIESQVNRLLTKFKN